MGSNTLHTHRVRVETTYGDVNVGDRVRAGAVGLATVKKVHTSPSGKTMLLLGKPGWKAGRGTQATPETPITVFRKDTYIRFTTDEGVQVVDLSDPASEFKPETEKVYAWDGTVVREFIVNRYATLCDQHSEIVTHPTLELAKRHATDPMGWCEGHRDACTCMREEDGSIETPSGSCPVHSWMVD